jgi:hypothetical protein
MSFLNGAELCLNFKPATKKFIRMLEHAKKMDKKRARSPSRVLVADKLAVWRVDGGYDERANVYPCDPENFTALVKWAKSQD